MSSTCNSTLSPKIQSEIKSENSLSFKLLTGDSYAFSRALLFHQHPEFCRRFGKKSADFRYFLSSIVDHKFLFEILDSTDACPLIVRIRFRLYLDRKLTKMAQTYADNSKDGGPGDFRELVNYEAEIADKLSRMKSECAFEAGFKSVGSSVYDFNRNVLCDLHLVEMIFDLLFE